MRGRWIQHPETGELIPAHLYVRPAAKRSDLPTPFVIGTMPAIKSMADGRIYDDKRSYHKSVARAGCEVIGYDRDWTSHIRPAYNEKEHEADIVADVKRAIEETS